MLDWFCTAMKAPLPWTITHPYHFILAARSLTVFSAAISRKIINCSQIYGGIFVVLQSFTIKSLFSITLSLFPRTWKSELFLNLPNHISVVYTSSQKRMTRPIHLNASFILQSWWAKTAKSNPNIIYRRWMPLAFKEIPSAQSKIIKRKFIDRIGPRKRLGIKYILM